MFPLKIVPYLQQSQDLPVQGKSLLAQFDDTAVVVYQAYRPRTGQWAAAKGYFGHGFSLSRMTWIKPGFLWMMHRSGWGKKPQQETVLAIRLKRSAFDELLRVAVPSTYDEGRYPDFTTWQSTARAAEVIVQWDPDHLPTGEKSLRRVIQLGLRGTAIRQYARQWIEEIFDISEFAAEQFEHVERLDLDRLMVPEERLYPHRPGV
jgi:hypothetical protein